MNQSLPKKYKLLAGKRFIMHNIEKLNAIDEIKNIVTVKNETNRWKDIKCCFNCRDDAKTGMT